MYTIKRAAELTGVPAATLRAWERRYDLVEPRRTDAGYRLYDDEAVARVTQMAALVADGWSASTAAAEVHRRLGPDGATLPPSPTMDGPTATARLVEAAAAMDPAGVAQILDEQLARTPFESVVDDWLMPTLEEVGRAWEDGRVSIAGEHLVAHAVLRRLSAAFDAAPGRPGGPRVIVGLPAGVHHELGIFAFAVVLRRLAVDVVYLGPDLPAPAWRDALETHGASCAVLGVPRRRDARPAREVVEALHHVDDTLTILVGGGHQDELDGTRTTRLGHLIAPAAAEVAALVG